MMNRNNHGHKLNNLFKAPTHSMTGNASSKLDNKKEKNDVKEPCDSCSNRLSKDN